MTRNPARAYWTAKFELTIDFPTPPLPPPMLMVSGFWLFMNPYDKLYSFNFWRSVSTLIA